ncbi:uncharacterized protein LOC116350887 [Contarinia nasturtii]|uniref:uncharacterized protein LOC116350887 n=1 Tax=Contarinia nasturtii TaxID=265458 RepID=UPI0012D4A3D5|nr:uncharacterized protein LOC116350887 [Contarinia nasturtii]
MSRKELSLNDLGDKFLLNSMLYLPLNELCVMKGVCQKFRILANKAFKRRSGGQIRCDNLIENFQQIAHILRCFGSTIKGVTIDGSFVWDLNTSLLTLLNEHCTKLTKLRLVCLHFEKADINIMKTLIQRLESMEMFYCTIATARGINYNVFLKEAHFLKEFTFIGQEQVIDLKCLNNRWPYMEKLQIISAHLDEEEILNQFLRKNQTVKYFCYTPNILHPIKRSWCPWTKMQTIDFLSDLVELSIELNKTTKYQPIFKDLIKLQRIVINCQAYNKPIDELVEILAKKKSLNVLGLWNLEFDDISTLPKLTNIVTLELREIKPKVDQKTLSAALKTQWNTVKNLYLDYTTVRDVDDLEFFVVKGTQLENLYLCNVKGLFIMPDHEQYDTWCTKRRKHLNIFIDPFYLMKQQSYFGKNKKIQFKTFKEPIGQYVNVICGANL